ncbi:type IV toxin-antitoxin system AbiEi family antitoxin domain-containing protein [Granulicoccus sp. GXG6511]|uniref:type IV toxin-antitoxin system AbiEi family antitoxin domain-containing protein n=1 Tax=Granulicoccus sp. GXG6511 TaxID=3381351 RepID=UPI003D7E47DC
MIDQLLSENLGIVRRAQLIANGITPQEVRRMLTRGSLLPLARGWYATPTADTDVSRAVRAGGALSCLSVLARHGVWVPTTHTLHVRRSRHHSGRKLPPGTQDCQQGNRSASRVTRPVDSLGQALLSAVRCVDADEAVAIMDSVLHLRLLMTSDLVALFADEPKIYRRLLDRVDARAEAGTESLVRCRLARLGIKARPQVEIDGVGRVDLLVGDLLVLEMDSVEHHTSLASYRNDRARDGRLVTRGYRVLRLTYADVIDNWDEVQRQILVLVRARKHKGPLIPQ